MITKEAIESGWKAAPGLTMTQIERILTAALAAMPGPAVKVKPLEWVLYRTKGYWCANTTAGRYIAWEIEDGALFCWNPEANSSDTVYRSLQAAKAAAQADYEARILSALTPAPDLASENERLMAALLECDEYFDNRADADCDQDGYIPNDEMKMLTVVRAALERT